MKRIFTISILLFAEFASGQVVLSGPDINPLPGDAFVISYVSSSIAGPGLAAGPITWDFHDLIAPGNDTETYLAATSTPYASIFPSSNVADYESGEYSYLQEGTSALSEVGDASSSDTTEATGLTILEYPFSYDNSFTMPYSYQDLSATFSDSFYSYGTLTVTYDGYGSLILPDGTFDNVARVHSSKIGVDSVISLGSVHVTGDTEDIYCWYMPAFHEALLSIQIVNSGGEADTNVTYASILPTEVPEIKMDVAALNVYPNPTAGMIHICFTLSEPAQATVKLYDITGKQIATFGQAFYNAGNNQLTYDTQNLPAGMYQVNVKSSDYEMTKPFTVN